MQFRIKVDFSIITAKAYQTRGVEKELQQLSLRQDSSWADFVELELACIKLYRSSHEQSQRVETRDTVDQSCCITRNASLIRPLGLLKTALQLSVVSVGEKADICAPRQLD